MAVYDVLPETNLNVDDIRDTLNANGGNVTNDVVSFFSEDAKINFAAKYKPTEYNALFDDENYWQADKGDCQIDIKKITNTTQEVSDTPLLEMKELFIQGDTGWVYKNWVASLNSPYRLGDFRKYKAEAEVDYIISGHSPSEVVGEGFEPPFIGVELSQKTGDSNELALKDIPYIWKNENGDAINSLYACILYWSEKDVRPRLLASKRRIDSNSSEPPYNTCIVAKTNGLHYLCPVLTSEAYPLGVVHIAAGRVIIPYPNSKVIQVNVTLPPLTIFISDSSAMHGDPDDGTRFRPRLFITFNVNNLESPDDYYLYFWYYPILESGEVLWDMGVEDTNEIDSYFEEEGVFEVMHIGDVLLFPDVKLLRLKGFRGRCMSGLTGEELEFNLNIMYGDDF